MTQDIHTEAEVYEALNKAIEAAGSQKAFGARYGLSPQAVNNIVHTRRPLSPAILRALGYAKVPRYIKTRISNS